MAVLSGESVTCWSLLFPGTGAACGPLASSPGKAGSVASLVPL